MGAYKTLTTSNVKVTPFKVDLPQNHLGPFFGSRNVNGIETRLGTSGDFFNNSIFTISQSFIPTTRSVTTPIPVTSSIFQSIFSPLNVNDPTSGTFLQQPNTFTIIPTPTNLPTTYSISLTNNEAQPIRDLSIGVFRVERGAQDQDTVNWFGIPPTFSNIITDGKSSITNNTINTSPNALITPFTTSSLGVGESITLDWYVTNLTTPLRLTMAVSSSDPTIPVQQPIQFLLNIFSSSISQSTNIVTGSFTTTTSYTNTASFNRVPRRTAFNLREITPKAIFPNQQELYTVEITNEGTTNLPSLELSIPTPIGTSFGTWGLLGSRLNKIYTGSSTSNLGNPITSTPTQTIIFSGSLRPQAKSTFFWERHNGAVSASQLQLFSNTSTAATFSVNLFSSSFTAASTSIDNLVTTTIPLGQISKFDGIKQLYYSNDVSKSSQYKVGIDNRVDIYDSTSIVDTRFDNYLYKKDNNNRLHFPTAPGTQIGIISIPSLLFGETIKPNSFEFNVDGHLIKDDGNGNLLSGSTQIGNLIYSHGMGIITTGSLIPSMSSLTSIQTSTFTSEYTIYNSQWNCTIEPSEYNSTLNPTAQTTGNLKNDLTGSEFSPYITTIGLYNDDQELIAVAKLSKPIKKSLTNDMTFKVNIDT